MIFKRFYDEKLAQASYLVGCAKTGEAAVVDANRDVEQYVRAAANEGLQISAVTETHIHADYVSGSRELAHLTGAQLFLSDEGDADWKYAFANQPNVTLVRDGESIRVGNIRLDVIKTPGHTPEHITFVLTDEPASVKPLGAFTGDFIFVGDVGRPDLLERAAGFEGTMKQGAKVLHQSLGKFLSRFDDSLLIWPAHGAGSACGKSLGGVPISSLGYEKAANWGLKVANESSFVEEVLSGQPEPPFYFKEMKRINKAGPALLGGFKVPARLSGAKLLELLDENAAIIDLRSSQDAAAKFIPGLINIPMGKGFTNWAGWFLPYDAPIYFLAKDEEVVAQAVRDLQMIGLDHVAGWIGMDAIQAYEKSGQTAISLDSLSTEEIEQSLREGAEIIDVRSASEFDSGHFEGAKNIPLGHLPKRLNELNDQQEIVLYCQAGGRSPIAQSILVKNGFKKVKNLAAGFDGLKKQGILKLN